MAVITLSSFAGLVGDLLAAVSRLLDSLISTDELLASGERLAVVDREFTALVIDVRRDVETILENGVPSKQFVTRFTPFAAAIKQGLRGLEASRTKLLTLPPSAAAVALPDFDALLGETRRLDALLTDALAKASLPLPTDFWQRARENGEGPYLTEAEVRAGLLADDLI